jgi:hypothetical protein
VKVLVGFGVSVGNGVFVALGCTVFVGLKVAVGRGVSETGAFGADCSVAESSNGWQLVIGTMIKTNKMILRNSNLTIIPSFCTVKIGSLPFDNIPINDDLYCFFV